MSQLTYVSDEAPGLRRRKAGKGFTYLNTRGKRITDARTVDRIRKLAIPPAWTDVWICPDGNGHIQATGRDARGRKQYRYHPEWRVQQEQDKYARLIDFGGALPAIRKQVALDYRQRGLPRDKVLAVVVHLLESSLIRIGNDEYAKSNNSFGLTTLRDRHVKFEAGDVRFSFSGKSGKDHEITVHDPRTARIVRACRDIPGQRLFQYRDEEGTRESIDSTDVNEYLHGITGEEFTAKDFRTWVGTLLAAVALEALDVPTSDTEARRNATTAITAVSKRLGNTPTVARNSYVHPDIVDLYIDGHLSEVWNRKPARDSRYFLAEEKRLVAVLKAAHRMQRRLDASASRAKAA